VAPIRELVLADVERAAADLAETDAARADVIAVQGIAQRRRAFAAAAGLVEQQRAVFFAQAFDPAQGFLGGADSLGG
jgi:hypothetical protein